MAGASMNGIKARMKSVKSTMQITKAMELVATSKLRKLKERAESSRPYAELLFDAIKDCIGASLGEDILWTRKSENPKTLYIVIAGDRGLAGGYNSNIFKLTASLSADTKAIYLPVGRKAIDYYAHRNKEILFTDFAYAQDVDFGDCATLARFVCDSFAEGKFCRVVIVYTKFVSMITQLPVYEEILPLSLNSVDKKIAESECLGECDELMASIIPDYVGGIMWSAICESLASESGARRSAMNAANKKASEMIDHLTLKFNRARQAVITQEITEIVSGAEAL